VRPLAAWQGLLQFATENTLSEVTCSHIRRFPLDAAILFDGNLPQITLRGSDLGGSSW